MNEHPSLEPVKKLTVQVEEPKFDEVKQKTEEVLSVQEDRHRILVEINGNLQRAMEANAELDAEELATLKLARQYYEKLLARM
jgi:hypothetical protein